MQLTHLTKRLSLKPLSLQDADFIMLLLNTDGWIKFIGDRKVKSIADAKEYIQRILDKTNVNYWVVTLTEEKTPIGIITLIKREYLAHHDLGFAFLPSYSSNGYAYEASVCVLNDLLANTQHKTLLATTLKENTSSIKLLQKLGFRHTQEIQNENDTLQVYSISKTN